MKHVKRKIQNQIYDQIGVHVNRITWSQLWLRNNISNHICAQLSNQIAFHVWNQVGTQTRDSIKIAL